MIDSEVSPTTFSLAKFCSSTVALFVNLPLETVLRRGQVAVLSSPQYVQAIEGGDSLAKTGRSTNSKPALTASFEPIVPPGKYDGIFGTMYTIVNEEGSRAVPTTAAAKARAAPKRGKPKVAETVYRRGQGVEGLWRGWKVNWWGLVGLWAAANIGGSDGEF